MSTPSQQRLSRLLNQLKPSFTSNNKNIKYVLITGCSRGIGYGLVENLLTAKQGKYYVIASCRSPHKQDKLRSLLSKYPQNSSLIPLDISCEESIIKAMSRILAITNHIDILINNAARSVSNHPYESVLDFDATEMLQVFKTNVIGTALLVKTYIDLLKSDDNCEATKVINISSELSSLTKAFNGFQSGNDNRMTTTSYRLSKCSLNMLTRLQAGELGQTYNIIFVAVNPGWVKTDMGSTKGRIPPVTVQQSVNGIVNIMENMNMETHNGQFMDFKSQIVPF